MTTDDPPTPTAAPLRRHSPSAAHTALAWIDDEDVAPVTGAIFVGAPDLLRQRPHRSFFRPGVLLPIFAVLLVAASYATTTLVWPLHAVPPTLTALSVKTASSDSAGILWPAEGSAAVSVAGMPGTPTSTFEESTIASVTKVVTALLVLDAQPLALGEQGPDYFFTGADNLDYWRYRANGESALDVPVGGSLSQYQLLQGMLIGSANNYADRLARDLWPTDEVFSKAASAYLTLHNIPGVTVVDPTGIESGNVANPSSLIALGEKAMANPVIAEIVGTAAVTLPGAGQVKNTNELLADSGVVGIKTGTLDAWNLLAAKDITVDGTSVRLYAAVLGQQDDDTRSAVTRNIFAQLEQELQTTPGVTAGTVAGRVETLWGESVRVITKTDATVIRWNGSEGVPAAEYELGDARTEGATVGSLTVTGNLNTDSTDLVLDGDIADPSPWWRLTHPLDLFGITD